jgi:hypothetical protein
MNDTEGKKTTICHYLFTTIGTVACTINMLLIVTDDSGGNYLKLKMAELIGP